MRIQLIGQFDQDQSSHGLPSLHWLSAQQCDAGWFDTLGGRKLSARQQTCQLKGRHQIARSAVTTGIRAARSAGSNPPNNPMANAHSIPSTARENVTDSRKL